MPPRIEAKLDLVLGNDVTTPVAVDVFDKAGFTKVFDQDKIAIVLDHYTPCKDIKSAQLCKTARDFAHRFSITHFYDVGQGVKELSMDDRFTVANMAIEAGTKNGIFPVDEKTLGYVKGRVSREFKVYEADPDAEYESTVEIDLSALEPTVALPHLPSNTTAARAVSGLKIDQVVIGSCTNGRISDLRIAAEILKGRKVADGIRCIVIPATQQIYMDCLKEGLAQVFIEAGCALSTPTCGPCLGGHMGCMCEGERAVTTTNRNFVGRMGHVKSEVILASPAVAAASAVKGCVATPDELD